MNAYLLGHSKGRIDTGFLILPIFDCFIAYGISGGVLNIVIFRQ